MHAGSDRPSHTLLIVDDNPTNLGVLSDYLDQNDFHVLVAGSGESALKRVSYARPDLILLDVMLPGIDGFETCRRLKQDERTRDIPVIFMTALTDTEHKLEGFDVGGVDYITKPLQRQEVLVRVNTHLRLHDLNRDLQVRNACLERLTSRQAMCAAVSRELTSRLTLESLLPTVVRSLQSRFAYYLVGIWLRDDSGDALTLQALAGSDAGSLPDGATVRESGSGMVSRVYQTGELCVTTDVREDDRYDPATTGARARARIALPLRRDDDTVGVLDIQSDQVGEFDSEVRAVLQSLANQVAISIRNARLYDLVTELNAGLEQKVAERTARLERAFHQLESLDQAKTNFLLILSHELRTPLNIVYGYSQLLGDDLASSGDEEVNELMDGINTGTRDLKAIVDAMTDATSFDSDAIDLNRRGFSLCAVIEEVIREFRAALDERELDIATDNLIELPPLHGDQALIQKAFCHLISNAIKYTPDGGAIRIIGACIEDGSDHQTLEVVIKDSGIGIEPSQLELIFEKFYQTGEPTLHSSSTTQYKGGGPGLGLAIVKGIVTAHGGQIWAESDGHDETRLPGSRFYVRLPCAA